MKRSNDEIQTDTTITERSPDRNSPENTRRTTKGETMLEETLSPIAPNGVAVDFVSDEDNGAYDKAFKGVIHAILIPLILGWVITPMAATIYLVTAAVLYGTVFRKKSQGFWGVVTFVFGIVGLFIVGGVR